jgi:hypothetical protein
VTNPDFSRVLTSDSTPYGAIAQSGLTYDGSYLTLVGSQRIQSDIESNVSTNKSLHKIPVLSGCGAYFDYCVSNNDGSSKRLGTVMTTWNTLVNGVTWTDTSTPDIGDTRGISFTVTNDGTDVSINSVITNGTWNIKLAVRIIY